MMAWRLRNITTGFVTMLAFYLAYSLAGLITVIGVPHLYLLACNGWILFVIFPTWYCESYFSLRLTWTQIMECQNSADGPSLENIITTPLLLDLFETHLLKEWSIENIEFFKDAVLYEIFVIKAHDKSKKLISEGRQQSASNVSSSSASVTFGPGMVKKSVKQELISVRKQAWKIYSLHIIDGAWKQVNLRGKTFNKLNKVQYCTHA